MIIGIIWGLYLKISVAFILPVTVIVLYCGKYKRIIKIFFKQIIIFFIMFTFGLIYINVENDSYEKIYKLHEITEKAVVISEPQETNYRVKYTIKIVSNNNLNNKKFIIQLKKSAEKLQYDDLIKFNGEYNKPSVARNYGGFDYSNYLKTKQIHGVIEASEIKRLEQNEINFILQGINKFKNIIINNAKEIIRNSNVSGILIGILIGDTENIDDETVNDFKDSSLAHLLAVSGQHITYIIIAMGFTLKVSKVGKRSSYFISILAILLFTLLTGASAAVVRASFMGILVLFAKIVYRKPDIFSNLATASILIFINNPFAIYDIGLWLSYRWNFRNCFIK